MSEIDNELVRGAMSESGNAFEGREKETVRGGGETTRVRETTSESEASSENEK